MAQPERTTEQELDALLTLWERGGDLSPPRRGLLLLAAALPDEAESALVRLPIGRRDAALLDLGDRLFGDHIACTLRCAECDEPIEIGFASDTVRVAPRAHDTIEVRAAGTTWRARLPDSGDLIAIEHETDAARAESRLLERCLVAPAGAAVSGEAAAAIGQAMSAADPQAEILLDVACPACAAVALAPFDLVGYLWARLDHWARAMLAAVDSIAVRYGWSEAAILAMSPRRRQTYLDLIAGAAL